MRLISVALAALFAAGPAVAADLVMSVRSPAGRPIGDVVVTVEAPGAPAPTPARFAWPMQMVQKDMEFAPFILVAPVGADVSFPNQDTIRHHVYSFSPTKRFELKLYGRGESRSVKFDKAGVVAVGCNIHDGMVGFIKVVNTPYAAKTAANGEAILRNLPAGPVTVRIWHPYMKSPQGEQARPLTLPRDGVVRQAMAADVRTPVRAHSAY